MIVSHRQTSNTNNIVLPANRLLDNYESATEILNRRATTYHVVTISRIKGELSKDSLRKALEIIQKRHPRLNSRIIRDKNNHFCYDTAIDAIPLEYTNKLHEWQWQEVVIEELNQQIESDKYLMRTVLVNIEENSQINYLITTLHHAITDGLSSVKLHSEIIHYCQKISSHEAISEIVSLKPLPSFKEMLPQSMQGLTGIAKSALYLLRVKLQDIYYKTAYLGFERYVPIEYRRTSMIHRQLDATLTEKFISTCKREGTTVHSALCAVMMLAVAKKISANQEKDINLNCISYVNLRQRLKFSVNDEDMGILISSISSFHRLGKKTLFWDLARDVKQQLENKLKREDVFGVMLLSRIIMQIFLNLANQIPASVVVTNIGRVKIPLIYGNLTIEEISFATAVALFGGTFAVAVSTFNEKMFLNFLFSEPALSQESMTIIADNAMDLINKVSD